tara:strand:+ start:349 stop:588 length:240 start_codon:yes stop_codon:yes gene_type:complete
MKKKIDKIIDKSLRFHHRDIHEEFSEMKLRAQVKSKWYYIFWGMATASVVAGQIYVGSGYNKMSDSLNRMTSVFVRISR